MGKLADLLKWKKSITIKNEKGLPMRDEEGNPILVYMRIIGDKDLEEALLKARYASSMRRATLADKNSEDYITGVAIFEQATPEQCVEMIVQGRSANWAGEAFSNVVIPDLPKIEEVAIDPDAPTLVELEKLDKLQEEEDAKYRLALQAYVESREKVLRAELKDIPLEKLIEMAKDEVIIVSSVSTYLDTLLDEKVWRSVYQDDTYTTPEFKNIEEFQNLHLTLKTQLRDEYQHLEQGLDNIKN